MEEETRCSRRGRGGDLAWLEGTLLGGGAVTSAQLRPAAAAVIQLTLSRPSVHTEHTTLLSIPPHNTHYTRQRNFAIISQYLEKTNTRVSSLLKTPK